CVSSRGHDAPADGAVNHLPGRHLPAPDRLSLHSAKRIRELLGGRVESRLRRRELFHRAAHIIKPVRRRLVPRVAWRVENGQRPLYGNASKVVTLEPAPSVHESSLRHAKRIVVVGQATPGPHWVGCAYPNQSRSEETNPRIKAAPPRARLFGPSSRNEASNDGESRVNQIAAVLSRPPLEPVSVASLRVDELCSQLWIVQLGLDAR